MVTRRGQFHYQSVACHPWPFVGQSMAARWPFNGNVSKSSLRGQFVAVRPWPANGQSVTRQ
eukprot:8751244-Lingulodinium_polyedra.AAC.1